MDEDTEGDGCRCEEEDTKVNPENPDECIPANCPDPLNWDFYANNCVCKGEGHNHF